jgi:hypothetical protein
MPKIRSIIPAVGWYEATKEDNGDLHFEPLACWALTENSDAQEVEDEIVGVTAGRIAGSLDYTRPSNFVGYCAPSDFSDLGISLRQGIEPRNTGG